MIAGEVARLREEDRVGVACEVKTFEADEVTASLTCPCLWEESSEVCWGAKNETRTVCSVFGGGN